MTKDALPSWAKVAGILLVPILTAGIAWGVGQARLAALELRVQRVEADSRENTRARIKLDESLRNIALTLHELKGDVKQLIRGANER